ncbi:MAG: ABC transporter permease subunit [Microthrixaceae bacterium]
MSTANVLIEELGPRGKRRVRIATVVVAVVGALLIYWVYVKLSDNGQLEAARWTDLFDSATLEFLGRGLLATLQAAVTAGAVALVLGLALALLRLSRSRIASWGAVAWVELFRGLPLLLLIFGVFAIDTTWARSRGGDAFLGTFWSVVVALVLYNSAVLSEVFRAGVRSLDSGQTEAAQSIGMSYRQAMSIVVLPQAIRRMVPTIVAQMATLTKDVSLGFVIGYEEFVRRGTSTPNFGGTEVTNFQAYVSIGIVYFFIVWGMAKLAQWLETRQQRIPKTAGAGGADPNIGLALDERMGAAP